MMTESIALALIAIASAIVSAVIKRMQGRREASTSQQEDLQKYLFKQSDEMLLMLKARETQQAAAMQTVMKELESLKGQTMTMLTETKKHHEIEKAVDGAIIASIKGLKPNGDLKYAEHLLKDLP